MEKFHLIVPLDRAGEGSDTVRISPSKSGFKAARNAPETSGGGGDGCGWVTDERENAAKMTESTDGRTLKRKR